MVMKTSKDMDLPKIEPNLLGCSWEDYKRMALEFHTAAPSLNLEELDSAFKCLQLGYFNLNESDLKMWKRSAVIVLEMAMEDFLNREQELLSQQ